ncbi:MAG TPA: alpha/beta hydrolase [Kofleriaceae bacterium]|nr:alpha/beta hydrolase [Kofleriaceae bacterium]
MIRALALVLAIAACGPAARPAVHAAAGDDDTADDGPVFSYTKFTPRSFTAKVTGKGRPVIFIPGLGCPGDVWDDTVAKLDGIQAHVLTLAGFAGEKPIKPPLAATVRHELVRYIRANHLVAPIVVGHSMGGFIAYWIAETAPGLIGGVIVVDAGPALADTDVETARSLRNMWAQAGDDELPEQVRTAYSSMVSDPKEIAPYIDEIARSDRQTMGDAIYELVTTDLRDQLAKIKAPLLLVLADGGYQQMYRTQVEPVKDHEVVVLAKTRHFVMFDDPDGFVQAIEKFLADHPAP